jgi:hypothetical protein
LAADSLAALGASLSPGADPIMHTFQVVSVYWSQTIWRRFMSNGESFHVPKKIPISEKLFSSN